jgi:hypothetical protein
MPPKVRQLSFISPDYEKRRFRADLVPPVASGLAVLPQAKIGEASVQSLADNLSTAQPHFVHTAWCAVVLDLIAKTVYQKDSQPGNRLERLFAPLQCDMARRHHNRSEWPSIAMNVDSRERDESFSGATFGNHGSTTFSLPLFRETHRGDGLGKERLSQQGGEPGR